MTGIGVVSMQGRPGDVMPETAGAVVELHGDIDLATTDRLQDCLAAGLQYGGDVFVDLADVTLIDGASLSVLVRAGRTAERHGQAVHLLAPSTFVRHILAAAELSEAFPVVDEVPKATVAA